MLGKVSALTLVEVEGISLVAVGRAVRPHADLTPNIVLDAFPVRRIVTAFVPIISAASTKIAAP